MESGPPEQATAIRCPGAIMRNRRIVRKTCSSMGELLAGTTPLSAQSVSEVKEEECWKRMGIARNFLYGAKKSAAIPAIKPIAPA